MTDARNQEEATAFGIDLRLRTHEEGGRKSGLGPFDPASFQYRPNWGFEGLDHPLEQAGAPVFSWSQSPVDLGHRVRAVIVPMYPAYWTSVDVGTQLTMYEGLRACGDATVRWRTTTSWPVSEDEYFRFDRWTKTGTLDAGSTIDGFSHDQ